MKLLIAWLTIKIFRMINDLLWQFFALSAKSSNASDLVRPFPALYYDDSGAKDFDRLSSEIHKRNKDLENFLTKAMPDIKLIKSDQVIRNLFKTKKSSRPDFVFRVDWPEGREARFQNNTSRGTLLAFHGSKPENFYSILQHGLVQCLNKRNLFGDGTYLTTEIEIALEFAPSQLCSILDANFNISSLRCVALCEVAKGRDSENYCIQVLHKTFLEPYIRRPWSKFIDK